MNYKIVLVIKILIFLNKLTSSLDYIILLSAPLNNNV